MPLVNMMWHQLVVPRPCESFEVEDEEVEDHDVEKEEDDDVEESLLVV